MNKLPRIGYSVAICSATFNVFCSANYLAAGLFIISALAWYYLDD